MLRRVYSAMKFGATYGSFRLRRFASRTSLDTWQDLRVRRHLRFVVAHSRYYRELFDGHDLDDWRSLPITDKRSMMANFDSFNTLGIGAEQALAVARTADQTRDFRPTIGEATVGLSSGTSGNYSLFLSSTRENREFIAAALAKLMRGSPLARHRIAFFHRAHSNLYRDLDAGRLRHQFFDLSEQLEQQYARLEELVPTLIIGPPFVLRRLGEAKSAGHLRVSPGGLLSVAEVLGPEEQTQIESDFGVRLDQAYIATEGFIAATCRRGSLHINEDMLVVQRQWLDRGRSRFVPIITDFRRRVQPIIRYRLDDVLVESEARCDCGSQFAILERIEGRCDDVLILKSRCGDTLCRVFPDFVRRAVCFLDAGMHNYRIRQESLDRLIVQIDVDDSLHDATAGSVSQSLLATFERLGCIAPVIHFEKFVQPDPRVKMRRVVRDFHSDLT